ncbi:hypothetical protein O9G_006224, partial [Rozella allomycis CSF55]
MTDRMTDKNSESPTEAQNAVELRHEHLFDDDDDMIQPDSNDHSQRLREERNNWQNVQEQAIRGLVRCTTCVYHPKFCRVHGEKYCRVDISCMVIDT